MSHSSFHRQHVNNEKDVVTRQTRRRSNRWVDTLSSSHQMMCPWLLVVVAPGGSWRLLEAQAVLAPSTSISGSWWPPAAALAPGGSVGGSPLCNCCLMVDPWLRMLRLRLNAEVPTGKPEVEGSNGVYGEGGLGIYQVRKSPQGFSLEKLESQMTADIQAILQLLQRQTTAGPPAYSTVTSSPEYQRPAVRVQPLCAVQTELSLGPAPPLPQSPGPEITQNQSKESSPVVLHTETLPDENFGGLLDSDMDSEHKHKKNDAPSLEQRHHHHQEPPRSPAGRQASLPDVPSSSGMLGLHRPVSDPGLPGK